MPKIFISYRREDSRHVTGRVYDRLVMAFGQHRVFKDVDSLPLGVDFRKALHDQVAQCDVLLAVIGDAWLRADGTGGTRRIDDETDFVRIEIEAALKRDIHVIPLLVGDAPVPKERQLPASLAPLAYRNGTNLREDPHFNDDIDRLIRALRQIKPDGSFSASDSSIGQSGVVAGSPFGPRAAEVVTAEAVFTASALVGSTENSNHTPAANDASSSSIFEWLAVLRWGLVAVALFVAAVIGYEEVNRQHGIGWFLILAPTAVAFAAFPGVYRRLWVWSRGGTLATYRQNQGKIESQIVFWIVYVSVIVLFLVLGSTVASLVWPQLPWEPPPLEHESLSSPAPSGEAMNSSPVTLPWPGLDGPGSASAPAFPAIPTIPADAPPPPPDFAPKN